MEDKKMSAKLLDCRTVAEKIIRECREEADTLRREGIVPKLGIVRVGAKGPDLAYEKGALRTMEAAGVETEVFALPADITQEEYIAKIREINADTSVHGILAFRPLDHIDENEAISKVLSPEKDVDCCTPANVGKLVVNDPTGLYPCTANAIMEVIDYYADEIREAALAGHGDEMDYVPEDADDGADETDVCTGLDVCVINNSNVIGKPLSMMLTNRFATVTVVHHLSKKEEMVALARRADVVVAATPFKNTVTSEMIKPGAVVIDASIIREKMVDESGEPVINEMTGRQKIRTVGCCTADVAGVAGYITPVPGLGAVTSARLAGNLIKACRLQI